MDRRLEATPSVKLFHLPGDTIFDEKSSTEENGPRVFKEVNECRNATLNPRLPPSIANKLKIISHQKLCKKESGKPLQNVLPGKDYESPVAKKIGCLPICYQDGSTEKKSSDPFNSMRRDSNQMNSSFNIVSSSLNSSKYYMQPTFQSNASSVTKFQNGVTFHSALGGSILKTEGHEHTKREKAQKAITNVHGVTYPNGSMQENSPHPTQVNIFRCTELERVLKDKEELVQDLAAAKEEIRYLRKENQLLKDTNQQYLKQSIVSSQIGNDLQRRQSLHPIQGIQTLSALGELDTINKRQCQQNQTLELYRKLVLQSDEEVNALKRKLAQFERENALLRNQVGNYLSNGLL